MDLRIFFGSIIVITFSALVGSSVLAQEAQPAQAIPFKKGQQVDFKNKQIERECGPGTFVKFSSEGQALISFDQSNCRTQTISKDDLVNPFAAKITAQIAKEKFDNRQPMLGHAILIEAEIAGRTKFSLEDLKAIVDAIVAKVPQFPVDIVVALDGNPPQGSLNDQGSPEHSYLVMAFNRRSQQKQVEVWADLANVVNTYQKTADAVDQGLTPAAELPSLAPFEQSYASAMKIFETELEDFSGRYPTFKRTVFRVTGGPTGTPGDEPVAALLQKYDDFRKANHIEVNPNDSTRKPISQALLIEAELAARAKFSVQDLKATVETAIEKAPGIPVDLVVVLDGTPANSLGDSGAPPHSYIVKGFNRRTPSEQTQIWADLRKITDGYQKIANDIDRGIKQPTASNEDPRAVATKAFTTAMDQFSKRYPTLKHSAIAISGSATLSTAEAKAADDKMKTLASNEGVDLTPLKTERKAAAQSFLICGEVAGRTNFSVDDLKTLLTTQMKRVPGSPLDLVVALDGTPPATSLRDPGSPDRGYIVTGFNNRSVADQQRIWENLTDIVERFRTPAKQVDAGQDPAKVGFAEDKNAYAHDMAVCNAGVKTFATRYPSLVHTALIVAGTPMGEGADEVIKDMQTFSKANKIELHGQRITRRPQAEYMLAFAEIAGRTKFSVEDFKTAINQMEQRAPGEPIDIAIALDGTPKGSLSDPGMPQRGYYVSDFSKRSAVDQAKIWADLSKIVEGYKAKPIASPTEAHYSSSVVLDGAVQISSIKYPWLKHVVVKVAPRDEGLVNQASKDEEAKIQTFVANNKIELRSGGNLETERRPLGEALLVCAEMAGGTRLSPDAVETRVEKALTAGQGQSVDLAVALDGDPPANSWGKNPIPNSFVITNIGRRSPQDRKKIWADLRQTLEASRENPHLLTAGTSQYIQYGYALPNVAEAAKKAGVNAGAYDSTLKVFVSAIQAFGGRYPEYERKVDLITGGASVTQTSLQIQQVADAEAGKLMKDIENYGKAHSIPIFITQTYRDVLAQVQDCVYAGFLESSIRLPGSATGLTEIAKNTGGGFSVLEGGAPVLGGAPNINVHEGGYTQGNYKGFVPAGFNPQQLEKVIAEWGPKNNSAKDIDEVSKLTDKFLGSIKMEPANTPLEMNKAKLQGWVNGAVSSAVRSESPNVPLQMGAAQMQDWKQKVMTAVVKSEAIGSPLEMGMAKVNSWVDQTMPQVIKAESVASPREMGIAQVNSWIETLASQHLKVETVPVPQMGATSINVDSDLSTPKE